MSFALKEELFYSNQSFREYENNVRDESSKIFTDNCIYGELEFINKFDMELNNKIKLLKTKFKNSFRKRMDSLESEIIVKMNDVLSQYNQVMYLLLDTLKSEQQFRTKHKELKAQSIEAFKEKSSLKDNEYKNEKISILAEAIEKSCNEFHERFLDQMEKSRSLYETKVNDSSAS
jgi:50S ribosomal subunit-associated GTPase HflX